MRSLFRGSSKMKEPFIVCLPVGCWSRQASGLRYGEDRHNARIVVWILNLNPRLFILGFPPARRNETATFRMTSYSSFLSLLSSSPSRGNVITLRPRRRVNEALCHFRVTRREQWRSLLCCRSHQETTSNTILSQSQSLAARCTWLLRCCDTLLVEWWVQLLVMASPSLECRH